MAISDTWSATWSDTWGSESSSSPTPVSEFYNTQVEIYVDTAFGTIVDIINGRFEPTCLSELTGNGAGSFKVSKSDPKILKNPLLLDYRNYVKIRQNGLVIGGFIIQNKRTVIVGAGEESDEMWEISGEGPKSWAKDASVYPALGLKSTSAETRYFNFSTERGSWYKDADWPFAIRRWKYLAPKAPKGTAPAQWPDAPNAQWMWDSAYDGNDPQGYCYFRHEFTVTGTAGVPINHAFFIAADDAAEVFVDGEQKAVIEQHGWMETTRVELELEPGAHVIGVKAYNYRTGQPGEIITALFKYGDPTVPSSAVLLNHSGMANTWRVNGYPTVEPGWTAGDVLLTLLNEAKARGVRFANNFTPTFSATTDSAGQPWDNAVSWSFGIGTTYDEVFQAAEELGCNIYVDPDTLQMHVWKKRGVDRSIAALPASKEGKAIVFTPGHNLLAGDETGQAEIANTLMLRTPEGWVEKSPTDTTSQTKYGRIETQMSTQMTAAGAQTLVDALFAQKSLPEVTATFTIVPVAGMIPFIDFNVGDWVSAPGAVPGVKESRRIMSISFAEDSNTGRPVYALEFDTIFKDRQTELERWVSRLSNSSAIGGGFTNSSDLPSSVVVVPPGSSLGPVPDAPTGLVVSSLGRWTTEGTSTSDFGLTWNPVISGYGFGTLVVDHYEVWGRPVTQTEMQRLAVVYDTLAYLTGYKPGETWSFAVRAISTAGAGEFSVQVPLTAEAPLVALGKPSTPTLTSDFGVVKVVWDGLLGGTPAPPYVRYVRVERKLTSASTWTSVGALVRFSLQDLPGNPGQSFDYRLVAVDIYGRDSNPSDPATIVVQGVDLGNLEQDVKDAVQAAQDAADAAAAIAGSAADAAEQAQIDADNAVTSSTTAQQVAEAAQTAASNAQTAAGNAITAANGKNKIVRSVEDASLPANYVAGDQWWKYSGSQIVAMWLHDGTNWVAQTLTDSVITNLNAATITAGFLNSDRIQANSITADKVVIGGANLLADPSFYQGGAGWTFSTATPELVTVADGPGGVSRTVLRTTATATDQYAAYNKSFGAGTVGVSVKPGSQYRVWMRVRLVSGTAGSIRMRAGLFRTGQSNQWPAAPSILASSLTPGVWTEASGIITVPQDRDRMSLGIHLSSAVGTTFEVSDVSFTEMATGELIVDGAISTVKLTAEAVTADKIKVGTITGDRISAGTISANKLLITNLTNIAEDPSFEYSSTSGVAWTFAGGASVVATNPRTGSKSLAVPTAAAAYQAASSVNAFSVEEADQYRLSAWVRLATGTVSNVGVTLRIRYGATESTTDTTTADIVLTPEGTSTTYVRMSDIWTVPAGAKYARVDIVQRDTTAGRTYHIDDLSVYKLADGELIVDGAITAQKIGAEAVTAEKIQAESIATMHLQAESITTEKIASESITSEQIAADTILANNIAAGAITADLLASNVGSSLDLKSNQSVNILINDSVTPVSNKLGTVQTDVANLTTYYSFGTEGAIIGKTDSTFKLHLMNDRIEIRENGARVSWWDAGRMVVTSFEGEEVVLGNHKLEKYGTGTVVRRV